MLLLNLSHSLTASHLQQIEAPGGKKVARGLAGAIHFDAAKPYAKRLVLALMQSLFSALTVDRLGQRLANLLHGGFVKVGNKSRQTILVNGLHMIEIDRRGVLQSMLNADDHFAGDAVDGRENRGDHDGRQKGYHVVATQDDDRSRFVRFLKIVEIYVSTSQGSGHTCSSSQSFISRASSVKSTSP